MKISCISDLHIRKNGDDASNRFKSFLNHEKVLSSDRIYLLGDIFDLMIGNHLEYLDQYSEFFELVLKAIRNDIQFIYVEGNHDFHLEKVFLHFKQIHNLPEQSLVYRKTEIIEKFELKKILLCHGDLVDDTNISFQKWKRIYSSWGMEKFVNHILPYSIVKKLGEKASENSKKRNKKIFNYEEAKNKYIDGARRLIEKESVDILIAGHTHIKENIKIGNAYYLNNGYPIVDKCFIYIESDEAELISLI